jgi:hypothetical protein
MNYIELNNELRQFFKKLIADGHIKTKICSLILGQQKLPMFTTFLEDDDRNFGIKVLTQIFENMGYELKIVPVPKNEKSNDTLNEIYKNFQNEYQHTLIDGLANMQNENPTGKKSVVADAITQLSERLFSEIIDK